MDTKSRAGSRPAIRLVTIVTLTLVALTGANTSRTASAAQTSREDLPVVRIGIVIDGPGARNDEISRLLHEEITSLNRRRFDVRLPENATLVGDWTVSSAERHLDLLLEDDEIDVVLAMGVIASTVAIDRESFSKPVIAPFVTDVEAILGRSDELVTADGRTARVSGVDNLSVILSPWDVSRDLAEFYRLVGFSKLAFVVDGWIFTAIDGLQERIAGTVASVPGVDEFQIVTLSDDVDETLAAFDPDVDAAILGVLVNAPPEQLEALAAGLIERRLPSMSLLGRQDVTRGIMLGLAYDSDLFRVVRRIAVYVQRILLGENAGDLPVELAQSTRLTFNRSTARAVGFPASWELLTDAEIIDERRTDPEALLTLRESIDRAVEANADLRALRRALPAAEQSVRFARGSLLPQLNASLAGIWIDRDRAAASFGSQAERTLSATLGASWLLWSDGARAAVDLERLAREALESELEQLRLDIVEQTSSAYLNVVRAGTAERIRRQNLDVTRVNLELARDRLRIGVATSAEVARWESEIAIDRKELIDAIAARNQAEIELNRLMSRALEHSIEPTSFGGDQEMDLGELGPYLDTQEAFDVFRDFMAHEALLNAPELARIDAAIDAQRRVLTAARRSFWSPTIVAQGELVEVFGRGGEGTTAATGFEFPFDFEPAGDTNWALSLHASLPVFEGWSRVAERMRALEDLERLRIERAAAAQRIEQRVRSAMHAAGASRAGIGP